MKTGTCVSYRYKILMVSNQNGISLLYIMLEMHHSGWEPSNIMLPVEGDASKVLLTA